jgi:hypothetical protein
MTQEADHNVRQALQKLIEALYWVPQTVRPGELLERVSADPDTAHVVVSRLGQALQSAQLALDQHASPVQALATPHQPPHQQAGQLAEQLPAQQPKRNAQPVHQLDLAQLQRLRLTAALAQLQLQSLLLDEICAAIGRASPLAPEQEFGLRSAQVAQSSVATAINALAAALKMAEHA